MLSRKPTFQAESRLYPTPTPLHAESTKFVHLHELPIINLTYIIRYKRRSAAIKLACSLTSEEVLIETHRELPSHMAKCEP